MLKPKRKITNKHNLPEAIVAAVSNDEYTSGDADISVTGLLKPPRITALEHKHEADIEEDASDRIWSLMGQIGHKIVERAASLGVAERRLYATIGGWKVSGGMDLYFNATIQDYKFVSVWKVKDGVPPEYEQQLNCYAELLRQNGDPVEKAEIVAILRDWSKMEATRYNDYPSSQVVMLNVPLWPQKKALQFMEERVRLHQEARKQLPLCTAEERWAKADVYAVMKPGRESAVKLHNNQADADHQSGSILGSYVKKRHGISVRCEHYCAVADFCEQFQKLKKERPSNEDK